MQTRLLFGIHMHQPVDNFKEVIAHAVAVCYAPFFEVAARYPQFKFSVHCSGWLLLQIKNDHPALYARIQNLARQGTIEFFSAGFYEPILSAIPSDDRIAQIAMLNETIEAEFGMKPQGLWLTERVWDASLIPDLNRAGIKFAVIDDYHFQCAGFDEAPLDGYYTTEEGGETLGIFPISKKLRYALPFGSVAHAIETIKSFHRLEDSAAIIFDDAEKFGMWPGTYAWVYEKGWLEQFIQAVLADTSIVTDHYGSYFTAQRTRGIAYLPNVSYYEMGEWSLHAHDAKQLEAFKAEMGEERYQNEGVKFLKGGIWKNFFVKYEESNRLHKRMLELSHAKKEVQSPAFNEQLYRLQTNDALWHGVFGGLYLPNLRDNAYSYLIACENVRYADQSAIVSISSPYDGYDKIKAVTLESIYLFDTKSCGQLIEWDVRNAQFNWQNTLTRREEAYHAKIIERAQTPQTAQTSQSGDGIDTIHNMAHHVDEHILEALTYDWYQKNSFIDHISDKSFTLEQFKTCRFKEYGDFADHPSHARIEGQRIVFEREGGVFVPEKHPATLQKTYTIRETGLDFSCRFSTDFSYFFNYALEFNLHFAQYERVTVNGAPILHGSRIEQIKTIEIADGYLGKKITITVDQPCDLLYFPLKTVSQSEQGFDLTVQGACMALVIPFSKTLQLEGRVEISHV